VETKSLNTSEMAKNTKKFIKISDGPLLLTTNPEPRSLKVFSLVELLIYFIKVSVKNSLTSFSASADESLL
jgi:hypothetical protein